ncbi:MAG: TIGR04086 family membrane protein [Firmicutes bacterium]|nr:TIGR04086 family membrane protein [Bacillota bacterium]
MVRQTSQNVKSPNVKNLSLFALLKGVIFAYIITIPFFIAFALILTYTNFPEKYISSAVMVTTIASILFAGSASAKSLKSRGWLNGGFVGLFYMLILYFLSSFVFRNFLVDRYVLTMVLIGVLAGAIGGILGVNFGTRSKSRKWKRK